MAKKIIPVEKGCSLDTENNRLLMTREWLMPLVIDALKAKGHQATESNINEMFDMLRNKQLIKNVSKQLEEA
tara:strand:+ start:14902 stop:15117 length:216 start_codon:yes stop_codon:yes gene_type:complete